MNVFGDLITVSFGAHTISILACCVHFYHYLKGDRKADIFKMAIILTIADFIFHSSYLTLSVLNTGIILQPLTTAAMNFSIFWGTYIAYTVYKSATTPDYKFEKRTQRMMFYIIFTFSTILGLA